MLKLGQTVSLYVGASPEERENPKVIHFVTGIPDGRLPARIVEALRLVHFGATRRIYFTMPRFQKLPGVKEVRQRNWKDITLTLRDTYGVTNVRYYEVSARHDRTLLSAFYYNETSESPSKLPPLIGSGKR